jgi:hypothetical protein
VVTAEFLRTQSPARLFVAEPFAEQTYDRYTSLSAFGSSNPAALQGLRESLLPNLNAVEYLPAVGNYDPLTVGLYRDLYTLLEGDPGAPPALEEIRPILNLFGGRYLLTGEELDLPLLYDAGPRMYANEEALPEAFVVHQARIIEDKDARLDALRNPSFDPRSEVILSEPPAAASSKAGSEAMEQAPRIFRRAPDRIVINVALAQPGFLVLTDTYYPGWRATVDGAVTEILAANHAFRAVELEAGDHTVMLEYVPLSFQLGAWLTLGTVSLLAATVLFAIWPGRTGQGAKAEE